MQQMIAQQAPAKEGTPMFAPGAPLIPQTALSPGGMPRGWQFPVGYNISVQPRSTEATSFDTLRNLAMLYDGIQLCEQVWLDTVAKLNLQIKPRPEITAELGKSASDSKYSDKIRFYTDFFAMPDVGNGYDLKSWLRAAVRDQLQIDAVAIYVRRTRGGGVYSLELVDGSTVKPLIDPRGRRPLPPFPSYQQFIYGVPAGLYTSEEMIYQRETTRTESIYGLSRVERIILRINQALRKENKDLARFTDGNTPPGILQPPDDGSQWTPETLLAYQEMWDALLAGNDQARSRIKVIQPGSQLTTLQEQDIFVDFDRFLLNVTAACYSMTMADLGFTENVNKSSGESQQNVFYRRAVQPLMDRYATLFTFVLRHYFNENDLVVTWSGFEESEDFNAMAASYVALTNSGITSPTTAAHMLNLPWSGDEIPNFVLTKEGPTFLEDAADPGIRKAANDSKLAGLQFAAANPGGPPQTAQGEDDDESSESDNTSPGKATKGNAKQQPAKKTPTRGGKSSNTMKGSASKATPLQPGDNASKGRASKTKRNIGDDDDKESDPGRISPIIQRGTKPAWRPPSKAQQALESQMAKAIVEFAKHTKLSKDGVVVPDDVPRETLLNDVTDMLHSAANEGRSIATSMEQRGLISAAKNIAGYAVQLVGNIIDMISEKASDIISDIFGSGEVADLQGAIEEAEAELAEWAENYADLVGDTEIHDMIEGTIADEMQSQGKTQKYWVNDGEPCQRCIDNAEASPLPLDEAFPDGSTTAPGHPRCKCSMSYA